MQIIENNINPQDSDYWNAIGDLGEVGQGNRKAIAILIQLCQNSENEFIVMQAVQSLQKIDTKNKLVVETFIKLIQLTFRRKI
ncbi:hypothetical protein [Hyella patelloides]|uniref:hypothetical protein n=1 Tax=Hyella patelloides TaxID=1982969 RepID=UPI003CCC4BCC